MLLLEFVPFCCRLAISRNGVHVGLLKYANSAREFLSLRRGCLYDRVNGCLSRGMAGSTSSNVNTTPALQRACEMFSRHGGYRRGRPQRLLIFLDETSTDYETTLAKAERLKSKGIEITIIGNKFVEVNNTYPGMTAKYSICYFV